MNQRDIERLRRKFIWVAMLAIFLAMFFIGGAIWLASYFTANSTIKATLNYIITTGGDIEGHNFEDYLRTPTITELFSDSMKNTSSFWYARLDGDFQIENISGKYDEGDETQICDMTENVVSENSGFGQIGSIYYKVVETDEGFAAAFIDGTYETSALSRLFYISLIVGAAGLIITFILVMHFSRVAIAPEIENSNRQKNFITNASHELKTPLAVIRANTEMQQMINGEDEWSESTLRQVDHLDGLIANLVMISKAQEMEDKSEMSEIDVSDAVRTSVQAFESLAAQSKLTLITQVPDNIRMVADASKIMQLTTLLVDNAIKYCDEGGMVKVELSSLKKLGVKLVVTNTYKSGANIDYNKFFDRFYREDQSHNIDRGGYGIGLSIAENICNQYKGSIRANWKNGEISFICQLF